MISHTHHKSGLRKSLMPNMVIELEFHESHYLINSFRTDIATGPATAPPLSPFSMTLPLWSMQ